MGVMICWASSQCRGSGREGRLGTCDASSASAMVLSARGTAWALPSSASTSAPASPSPAT
eukprot:3350028-Rhodomonas_salina.1